MSNVQIEIINVAISNPPTKAGNGKTYELLDVAYKNKSFQDKVEGKKIVGFSSPQVTAVLKTAQFGDKFTVVREKDGEFWKWTQLIKDGEDVPMAVQPTQTATPAVKPTATPTPKSTYETAEERAARQVMIVRQSSISSAIALLAANGGKKNTPEEVVATASLFEAFVMFKEAPAVGFADMEDDVPL